MPPTVASGLIQPLLGIAVLALALKIPGLIGGRGRAATRSAVSQQQLPARSSGAARLGWSLVPRARLAEDRQLSLGCPLGMQVPRSTACR